MSAGSMIRVARSLLGMGEPNKVQRWYARRNGSAYNYNFSWCDAGITWEAAHSGNYHAVCPAGDRAYTVSHAVDFRNRDQWHSGTTASVNRARKGDIVFFDWSGSNSISRIDHVGVVERNLGGGRVQTIECNTDDHCRRRVRSASVIAGYGRPRYGEVKRSADGYPGYFIQQGSTGKDVRRVQREVGVTVDGEFGPKTERAVKRWQREHDLEVDGVVGPKTWAAMFGGLDDMDKHDVFEAVWHTDAIDSGHKKNKNWTAATFIKNIETGNDKANHKLNVLTKAVAELAKQQGVTVDVDESEIAEQVATALDPAAIADAVIERLGTDQAKAVVDELAHRLAAG